MARQPTARAGKRLGRYRIERELGRGGMGVVYIAEDVNTGRRIALKTTAVAGLGGREQSRNQRRQRFVREVQALTQVNHDNVVHVIDAGEADDPDLGWLLFYSMEYVEGETLAQLVQRKGALAPGAAAAVCMQVAAGLGAAHAAGIVHRDVKPANIFISLDARALIGDFGICKIEGQTQITRRDQLVGTPNYLAPEQILGDPVSPATDVFALGALFYVITMNRPLRSHVDAAALLASAQSNEPRDRMMQERSVPDGIRKVIARCLERDPKKRWKGGTELADALSDLATRIPSLRDETLPDPRKEATSTQDRSNPFASVPSAPSGDVLEVPKFADPNDVEAAARALLGEVEMRESANKKVEEEQKPLPVARTESTVMFNLRAMEQEQQEKQKPLPVARTESTAIFKMRGGDDDNGPSLVRDETTSTASRLENTSMGVSDDPTPVGGETSAELVQPRVRSFDAEVRRPRKPIKLPKINLPALPRPAWVGISGAGGALLGIILVAALAPPSYSTEQPDTSAPAEAPAASIASRPRPELCPKEKDDVAVSAEGKQKAKGFIEQSRAAGLLESKKELLLGEAIKVNPLDAEAFFELSKVYASEGKSGLRDQAYVCVCVLAESSDACHKALRFLNNK